MKWRKGWRNSSFSNLSFTSPTSQYIRQPFRCFTYVTTHSPALISLYLFTAHSPTLPLLHLADSSFSNSSVALPTLQFILHPFRCFTYVTAHSPTLPLLHLRHNSFSNPSVALPTSQFILQPFRCFTYVTLILQPFCRFTYVTVHSPTLPLLHLRHSSFSNSSVAWPTSQLILQPFRRFIYVTAHSSTLPLLHLRHSSFSNPCFASPTSQALHLRNLARRSCILCRQRRAR